MSATPDTPSGGETLQKHVVDTLRVYAINGTLEPGKKRSEVALAERLGVSRTPIRHALAVLIEEGVMQRAGGRGYVVRRYDARDVEAAIEMPAAIEGLAAKKAALAGLKPDIAEELASCLADGDAIFRSVQDEVVDEARYAAMNATFHELVLRAVGIPLLLDVRAVLDRVPCGDPASIRFDRMAPGNRAVHLHQAHLQQHYMVAAMTARDGARAEALFREHGELIKVSLGLSDSPWEPNDGPALPIGIGPTL